MKIENLTIFILRLKHKLKVIFCYFAVSLKIPYSDGFLLVLQELVMLSLIKNLESDNYNKKYSIETYTKILNLKKSAEKLKIYLPEIYFWLSFDAHYVGKMDDWKFFRLKLIEKQKNIRQKKGYDFEVIDPSHVAFTIGNVFTLDAWIKSRILGFQKNNKLILPLTSSLIDKVVNPCMLNYLGSYMDIVEEPKQAKYYYSILKDCRAWHNVYIPNGREIYPYSLTSGAYIQSIWDQQERKPLFQLTDEHRQKGSSVLKKIGLPDDAWFVTCHVREPQFKGKESFRDSDIQTFFKAFEEITKRGGWVIRMGDKRMTSLPKMPQVFDYALSEHKSDWMDVFLLGGAKFMLGTSSGPTAVSHIFGVPIAMTNNTPTVETYLSNKDLFLPRLMKRIDDGRMLNLVELMTSPYNSGIIDGLYKNIFKVKTIPNTDLEIKNLCIEMMDRLEGTIKYSQEEEKLQEIFKKKTAEKEVMVGIPNFPIQCRLGKYFLNQHKNLLVNV